MPKDLLKPQPPAKNATNKELQRYEGECAGYRAAINNRDRALNSLKSADFKEGYNQYYDKIMAEVSAEIREFNQGKSIGYTAATKRSEKRDFKEGGYSPAFIRGYNVGYLSVSTGQIKRRKGYVPDIAAPAELSPPPRLAANATEEEKQRYMGMCAGYRAALHNRSGKPDSDKSPAFKEGYTFYYNKAITEVSAEERDFRRGRAIGYTGAFHRQKKRSFNESEYSPAFIRGYNYGYEGHVSGASKRHRESPPELVSQQGVANNVRPDETETETELESIHSLSVTPS